MKTTVSRCNDEAELCPFCEGFHETRCAAMLAAYRPSKFEFDEYCSKRRYRMCPFYRSAAADGMADAGF